MFAERATWRALAPTTESVSEQAGTEDESIQSQELGPLIGKPNQTKDQHDTTEKDIHPTHTIPHENKKPVLIRTPSVITLLKPCRITCALLETEAFWSK